MGRSYTSVPKVPQRARRKLGPPPDPTVPVPLPPALEGLLQQRHAAWLERAEKRSLHPDFLNRIKAQMAAERAVEESLARGRARIRYEIRRATDPARAGLGRSGVRFPSPGCTLCDIFRPVVYGFGVLLSPFLVYFGLAALLLLV